MVATVPAGGKMVVAEDPLLPLKVPLRRVDSPVEKGKEGRDDAPYSDINRSTDYFVQDFHSSLHSGKGGDRNDFESRRSKAFPVITTVGSDVASVTRGRRSKRCQAHRNLSAAPSRKGKAAYNNNKSDHAPIASRQSKTAAQNDIINLGMEFELGFGGSVARRHSKQSKNVQSSGHTGKPSSPQYCLVDKTEDHVSKARQQSDVSVSSDATKSRKSLLHLLSRNKEAHSRKSSLGTVVSTTTPVETIQKQHSSRAIENNHSFSQSKQLQRSELEYWSGLSVRVAMAVMQTSGSEKMAQKASNIVLDEARMQSGRERSSKMMRALSAKLSVALLEAGCEQKVGLAVLNAVMAYEKNYNSVKSAESMLFDDSRTNPKARSNVADDEVESVAPPLDRTSRSRISQSNHRSKAVSSTPAVASKRSKLQTIEKQILEKQRAIKETELRNQEKEREFNERIAAMEAATKKRLAVLDATKAALLEKAGSAEADQQDVIVDESNSKEVKKSFQSEVEERLAALDATKTELLEKAGATKDHQQDMTADGSKSKEAKNAFLSGVDGFVLGFNERIAAMEAAAKESLAALDATKTALFRQHYLADENLSAKK